MSDWTERPEYTPVPPPSPEGHSARAAAPWANGLDGKAASDGDFGAADADGEKVRDGAAPEAFAAAPVRAINEDDDGYDPYSDWHDQGSSLPLFERDPWE